MQEVRLIAPSQSLKEEDHLLIEKAYTYFEKIGYKVTLGKYLFEKDSYFGCASVQNRVEDVMNAYKDPNVSVILCVRGGYSVNQILPYLDYELIKKNPKKLIGYSDITALLTAIMVKTGQITYYGPMLKKLCKKDSITLESFERVLENKNVEIVSSTKCIDRKKIQEDLVVIKEGEATGKIVGGNLCTLNLLQGTPYQPNFKNVILMIEDDADDFKNDVFLLEFDRNLESLLQVSNMEIKGIIFGKFQVCSNMTIAKVKALVQNKEKLKDIPIIANFNFGHTKSMITIPLGGYCDLYVTENQIKMTIKNDK